MGSGLVNSDPGLKSEERARDGDTVYFSGEGIGGASGVQRDGDKRQRDRQTNTG